MNCAMDAFGIGMHTIFLFGIFILVVFSFQIES